MDFVYPKRLEPGDTIAFVAPSEPVVRAEIEDSKKYLESLGYKVKYGKHLFGSLGEYTSGTVENRASDLNSAFLDDDVRVIFMSKGGYTADQVLDKIDYSLLRQNPKIFVGYSDATILQMAFLAKAALVVFHGPNRISAEETDKYTQENLWRVLKGEDTAMVKPVSHWRSLKKGRARGLLVGGNLDTICSVLGTAYDPFPKLSDPLIFFWEEYDHEQGVIIRNLYQLKNAGIFSRCSGMVVGKLTKCQEKELTGTPDIDDALLEMTKEYDFPILWGVDFGHDVPKMTIPIGVEGWINTARMEFGFEKAVK